MVIERFTVKPIQYTDTYPWLKHKHYAHRIPSISYAFGLYENSQLVGVCCFGRPVSHCLIKNAMNGEYQDSFLELNRLCVNEGLPKNTLSYFVSSSLKLLPTPMVVVSYADSSQNHHGYIYQATNWIYTGLSEKFMDYAVEGLEHMHGASILDSVGRSDNGKDYGKSKVERLKEKYGDKLYMKERARKHRYFIFLGNKKEKKRMRGLLIYSEEPYPKGENKRYDASFQPETQQTLF